MNICYLGTGTWGFCLASLLASKGHRVTSWTRQKELAASLNEGNEHPHLPHHRPHPGMKFTTDLNEALKDADLIVESVTTAGIRPVFKQISAIAAPSCPIVITSKGIEQDSCLIIPEVIIDVLGKKITPQLALLSGPGYAKEIIKGLPTSVVGTAFDYDVMMLTCETFTTDTFRVYPNADVGGVAYGGALKNVIAIACGISDGLELGHSSKAALMTRGLHEIRKLAIAKGYKSDTLSGLSGLGDLCLTCGSLTSRNSRFGYLLAKGMTPQQAEKEIGMVIEGAYTCISALQISQQLDIAMPITEIVYKIIYENLSPKDAVKTLMQRTIKEEHL